MTTVGAIYTHKKSPVPLKVESIFVFQDNRVRVCRTAPGGYISLRWYYNISRASFDRLAMSFSPKIRISARS